MAEQKNPEEKTKISGTVDHDLTWEETKQSLEEGRIDRLGRKLEDILYYREWKEKILKKFVSVGDYILNKIFKYELRPDPQDGKKRLEAIRPKRDGSPPLIVLAMNDFPYSFEKGIIHQVLWSEEALDDDTVRSYVDKRSEAGYEVLWFVNPPELKSIPDVYHAHLISRQRPDSEVDK